MGAELVACDPLTVDRPGRAPNVVNSQRSEVFLKTKDFENGRIENGGFSFPSFRRRLH
jgi:hypothetical protein